MQEILIRQFGGPEVLGMHERPTPRPSGSQVLVRLECIGMNHADLMQRAGQYKASSGEPPFVPGLEGGGRIEAAGDRVRQFKPGDRVILRLGAPRNHGGTCCTHYLCEASEVCAIPEAVPAHLGGALWLAYLTAWGALVWRGGLKPGMKVLLPAASSPVAIAASQIVRDHGGWSLGLTRSSEKAEKLRSLPQPAFDRIHSADRPSEELYRALKEASSGGFDLIFDPLAAGDWLSLWVRLLKRGGTIHIYGLLGSLGPVNVWPLILKSAAIRGWVNQELMDDPESLSRGEAHVIERAAAGVYDLPVAGTFALAEAAAAHRALERAEHIGKFLLRPVAVT